MPSKKIKFPSHQGIQLTALLEIPAHTPQSFAVFAHCFTCNKNLSAVHNISKAFYEKGIAVLRFDFTGLGESEGDFEDTNFSSNVEDLMAACNYLQQYHEAPSLLIGHSLGGAAVVKAASIVESVKAFATIGAPFDPQHVTHLLQPKIEKIQQEGIAEVNIGGRSFQVKRQFLEDIREQSLSETLQAMRKAILVLHSPQDQTVGINNAAKMYNAAFHPKSFISLDGADHLLTQKQDSLYAGSMIAAWATRYL
jgi:putative redox protein